MLSHRLKCILDVVPESNTVADIGTDHGYIPVGLIKLGKVSKAIASDISLPSLQKAQEYVRMNQLENSIVCRLGNGIAVLEKDEVDSVVIAGMGGILISNILESSYESVFIEKVPYFVLQPVQQVKELRYYLYEHNFMIEEEYLLVENGKYYHTMLVKKGKSISSDYANISIHRDIYMEYGILNLKKGSSLLKSIMQEKMAKKKLLLNDLKEKCVQETVIKDLQGELAALKEVYGEAFSND